jgi:two-component system osmolarity sensor histidine kinase EnvZ
MAMAEALEIAVEPPRGLTDDRRLFYDLSGTVMTDIFYDRLPDVTGVDLRENWRQAVIGIGPGEGRPGDGPRGRAQAALGVEPAPASGHHGLHRRPDDGAGLPLPAQPAAPDPAAGAAAEDFGKGRTVPYRPAGATEVRSAGRAFLEMRGRIESQIEQRTMMLSGVSHDLRTPLTRMRLGLSMLDETPEVKDIERDVAEMEGLLDTFLDFARGEALDDPAEADPVRSRARWWRTPARGGGAITYEGPDRRSRCTCGPRRSSGR